MFVIELIYKAPLADIDAAMKAHMAFLSTHYAAGRFLASGRKIPRDGGIAIVRQDPFVARGLADVRVIEFRLSQVADDIGAKIAAANSTRATSR